MPNVIRNEILRLIALNHAEQWIPYDVAIQQLEQHGDRLIPGLIECLGDEDAEVRQFAAGLLIEAGQRAESAVPALVERLSDEDRQVKHLAVRALKRLGEAARPALPALKRLMEDQTEPYLRLIAAGTISRIAPEDPTSLAVIVEGLKHPVGLHRAAACEFLGERRSKSPVLNAMTLLSDEEFVVRFAAAKAIGKTFNNWMHAVAVCVAMLKDGNETNRLMGRECLLSIRRYVKDDLDLLTMGLTDVPWEVRLDIEEVLHELRR